MVCKNTVDGVICRCVDELSSSEIDDESEVREEVGAQNRRVNIGDDENPTTDTS